MRDLDTERIAIAGLAVADEQGASGLTLRAVARELGVTPMALYHHIEDKTALVALVVDRATSERPLPEPSEARWQEELWGLARWLRVGFQNHPATSQLRRQYRVWSPAIFAVGDRWIAAWLQSGLPDEAAHRAARASIVAIVGVLEEEAAEPHLDPPEDPALASAPNFEANVLAHLDSEADFELLVHGLIDGLHARLRDN
jgi:AcrR family transcriptional regulator